MSIMAPVAGVVQAKPIFQDINGKYIMEKKTPEVVIWVRRLTQMNPNGDSSEKPL